MHELADNACPIPACELSQAWSNVVLKGVVARKEVMTLFFHSQVIYLPEAEHTRECSPPCLLTDADVIFTYINSTPDKSRIFRVGLKALLQTQLQEGCFMPANVTSMPFTVAFCHLHEVPIVLGS